MKPIFKTYLKNPLFNLQLNHFETKNFFEMLKSMTSEKNDFH